MSIIVNIHTSFIEKLGVELSASNFNYAKQYLGELVHNEDFINPLNSELLDQTKLAFASKIRTETSIDIEFFDSKIGELVQDILNKHPESIKFVPRLQILSTKKTNEYNFITFDAVINNKELWESL